MKFISPILFACFFLAAAAMADTQISIEKNNLTGDEDSYFLLGLECTDSGIKEHCEVSRKIDSKFIQKKMEVADAHAIFDVFETKAKKLKLRNTQGAVALRWKMTTPEHRFMGNVNSTAERKLIDQLENKLTLYLTGS